MAETPYLVDSNVLLRWVKPDHSDYPAIDRLLELALREPGVEYQVFLLSGPDGPQTIRLDGPIGNDLPFAFAMGQRYVRLGDLRRAKRTSDLAAADAKTRS